ncbi:hypothetical protein [Endozoicomonas lisbonensis]|uniref:Glycosidase n=1 Tax=Endozoicomonas lisbonensis TaxID=3120522 RepID=A0ABV2SFR5_9GAMM
MKVKALLPVVLSSVLVGCAGGTAVDTNVNPVGTGPLADCNLPSLDESGPIRPPMYVTGTFSDSNWMHDEHRRMSYKGDGIYQIVMDTEEGPVSFQFASMGWKPQFSAVGGNMTVGADTRLGRGGFMKDTRVIIPTEGRYAWSFQVDENREPIRAMISQCAE